MRDGKRLVAHPSQDVAELPRSGPARGNGQRWCQAAHTEDLRPWLSAEDDNSYTLKRAAILRF